MNLDILYIITAVFLQACLCQDYGTPTYNPDINQPLPTNDYLNPNDQRYDNPYDPNRRNPNRNPYSTNQSPFDPNQPQYDPNRVTYDVNRGKYDKGSYDPNKGSYDPNKGSYDPNKGTYDPNRGTYEPSRGYESDLKYPQNYPDIPQRTGYDGGVNYGSSYSSGSNLNPDFDSLIMKEATYFIVASRMVRPGQIYKISANILRAQLLMTIRASISCNGVEISNVISKVNEGTPEILNMRVPPTSVPGDYKLRIEGLYLDNPFGGRAFVNETQLTFSKRFMTIFIQTDKPVYMQGQKVRFRVIPINTELKPFGRAIDVFILDPNRRIMKRWLSTQSNFGSVSLHYQLSDQPLFGEWHIRVEALGQVEESQFLVEEYYQTRFEVNVTMPAFFFNTDRYIHGRIMANYTSGTPVRGNLTLKATIRPIPQYRPQYYQQGQYNNRGHFPPVGYETQYTRVRPNYNPYIYNETGFQSPFEQYGSTIDEYGRVVVRDQSRPGQPGVDQPGWWYDRDKVYTRVFNFDEKFPFWMQKPDPTEYALHNQDPSINNNYSPSYTASSTYNYYNNPNYNQLPYLRFFNGTYDFKYPMSELAQLVPALDGVEVIITATVGDPFLDERIEGYSIARIFNSSLAVTFLGGSPQVFKPHMPFDVYAVEHAKGSEVSPQT